MRQTTVSPIILAALAALFSFMFSVAQPETAQADPKASGVQPAPQPGPQGNRGVRPVPANAPRPSANPAAAPHHNGPRPPAHQGPRPADRPVTYVTPVSERASYIGGIVSGSILIATGLAMGIAAIAVDTDETTWGDDNATFDHDARVAVGATGATAIVVGAIVVGIAGYHLHTWNTENSSVSLDLTPAYKGAGLKLTF